MQNKEFLYVGYYHDTEGNFILKVGKTNDLDRRRTEHNRTYKKDRNRDLWKEMGIGEYIRNDRFLLCNVPKSVPVVIKKEYTISLDF